MTDIMKHTGWTTAGILGAMVVVALAVTSRGTAATKTVSPPPPAVTIVRIEGEDVARSRVSRPSLRARPGRDPWSRGRNQGGLDSYLQVLDAQRNLFRSELDLATLQRQELVSIVELYRALGGGWTQP
jgi:hypothetical protein